MTPTEQLARAKQTEADIRAKFIAAQERTDAIVRERINVALPAQSGDTAAKKKMDALNAEKVKLTIELESTEIALNQANNAVNAAEAAVKAEEDREKARQALTLLQEFEARGAKLDAAFSAAVDEYQRLADDFHKLDRLGYPPSTFPLVRVNMQAAVSTKLMFTDLKQQHLAPGARKDFVGVIQGWAASVRRRAEAVLNRDSQKEAA